MLGPTTKQAGNGLALAPSTYSPVITNVWKLELKLGIPSDLLECIMLHGPITSSVHTTLSIMTLHFLNNKQDAIQCYLIIASGKTKTLLVQVRPKSVQLS